MKTSLNAWLSGAAVVANHLGSGSLEEASFSEPPPERKPSISRLSSVRLPLAEEDFLSKPKKVEFAPISLSTTSLFPPREA